MTSLYNSCHTLMMSFINGVHQLSQAKGLQVLGGGEARWGLNGAAGDNDRAVGFDDGSKWVSGEYECDI